MAQPHCRAQDKNRLVIFAAFILSAPFAGAQPASTDLPLMPWPQNISVHPGNVEINSRFSIAVSGPGAGDARVQYEVNRTFERLTRQTGIPLLPHVVKDSREATLNIVVQRKDHQAPQKLGDEESYSLIAASGQIKISASAPIGALRGIETCLQLVQQNTSGQNGTSSPGFSVPDVTIQDEPRFPWRGLSLDVSRHFIPVANVKRTLDGMAAVKLNVLHWHLSDDQGFRVESRKEPRLQQFGSDGMYYTQAEVRDVLAYARDRGIRVVPEFDMPGHATSWLTAYPKLGAGNGHYQLIRGNGILSDLMDPTQESTYRFLDTFVGEMAKLFPDEYFHIGGDEVDPKQWDHNPRIQAFMHKHAIPNDQALQTYFNQRLLKIVTKHGKHMEGWDEILEPSLPKSIVIQSWRGQESLWQAARQGYQGILSAGYYLDLNYPASYHYSIDPMKIPDAAPNHHDEGEQETLPKGPPPGTHADLTPAQQKLVLGGEAAMWEELTPPEILDMKLWPRLAAIAERLWSPESVTDTANMYSRLRLVDHWLEWLDLRQHSNPELMRKRLADPYPAEPLHVFASVLEPVRGYSRHAEDYNIFSSFNRLVDAIPPESDTARNFRDAVDAYLAGGKNAETTAALRKQLQAWADNVPAVRPMLEHNSLLNEDLPLADAQATLCKTGLEALSYLDGTGKPDSSWKQQSLQAVQRAGQRQANMRDLTAPAIEKLVEAVQ